MGNLLEDVGDGRVNVEIGSILFAFIAILVSIALLWRSDRKHAAVGRRYVHPAERDSRWGIDWLMCLRGIERCKCSCWALS